MINFISMFTLWVGFGFIAFALLKIAVRWWDSAEMKKCWVTSGMLGAVSMTVIGISMLS